MTTIKEHLSYIKQLEKELREARSEIKEDREIKERMKEEIKEFKVQSQNANWRGGVTISILRMILWQLNVAFGIFGKDINEELKDTFKKENNVWTWNG